MRVPRLTRRRFLAGMALGACGLAAGRFYGPRLLRPGPVMGIGDLSADARELVERAFLGVDRSLLWDVHVHIVGLGTGGSGCWVNPSMQSHLHPLQRLQFDAYLAASGVLDLEAADREYRERLFALHRAANPEGQLVLLGFDWTVDDAGEERPERTNFHVPNEYVLDLAEQHSDVRAMVSVHPYRADAPERLSAAHARGAVGVKWLPNAMGIDPSSSLCDPFYRRMAELDLPLLTHAGEERAVHADEAQELGNPLRLRAALDAGVRVVVAHCASLGQSRDLDRGTGHGDSFDFFLRLMAEPDYVGRLFGEISALTLANRVGPPLEVMLREGEWHGRLVNGSDYPLPAIGPLMRTGQLARHGFLDPEEAPLLDEIFEANSLLFDFVLKRRLRLIEGGSELRFAESVFESARVFG